METHLKGFGVENFRVFKDYTWFDFAPITILTGPNSSGKSSLNKALLLLENSISESTPIKLNFSNDSIYQLGNFERIISHKSKKQSIKFRLPYVLNHYPTLGESCNCEVEVVFKITDESPNSEEVSLSIFLNNDILLRYNENSLFFDLEKYLKTIFINNDDYKIVELKIPKKPFDVSNFFVDFNPYTSQPFSVFFVLAKKILEKNINAIERIKLGGGRNDIGKDYKEVLKYDEKSTIEEITNLYKKTIDLAQGKNNVPSYSEFVDDVSINEYGEEIEHIVKKKDLEPLSTLLKSYKLSDGIRKFIDNDVLGFSNRLQKGEWLNQLQKIQYQPSIRGRINRIYRKEEKDVLNELISSFFEKKISNEKLSFLKKWSESFNLSGEVKPFLDSKYNVQSIEIGNFPLVEQGLGISQIVAILLSIITNDDKKIFIFEEPEANLHPKLQSQLADMFIDASQTFEIQFIIETHSEYFIRKLQYLTAKLYSSPRKSIQAQEQITTVESQTDELSTIMELFKRKAKRRKKEDILIYYFHDPENIPAGEPQIKKIEILEDGSLSSDFGPGFFDEATNWKFELMRLKNAQKN